jgi:hypothetical protein
LVCSVGAFREAGEHSSHRGGGYALRHR